MFLKLVNYLEIHNKIINILIFKLLKFNKFKITRDYSSESKTIAQIWAI
jgi:hypothetical protein